MHFHNFNNRAGELLNIEVTSLFERDYTYDPNGRMTEVTDATGTTELAYDIYGKILSETFPSPADTAVVRSFDLLQRPSGISLGNTALAAYTYGMDGRLATLGNGTATLNYAYHPGTDQIASRSWQIGQNTPFLNMDNSFDDYSRLVEVSANNVAEIAYTLNDDNQRTAAALNDGTSWAYGYDTKGQLLTAVREDSQNTTLNDMDYAYDGIGNRTEAEEDTVEKEYTSNLLNQYTSIETTSATPPVTETPTYDADGNMLTNGPWTYTWNTESRLTSATNGTTVLEFQYDYMGRRVEKKVTENSIVTKQENYVYDGYKLIAIYDALDSNSLKMTFVWQPIGLDVPLCMTYGGNTYYYLTDGNKNVTGLFDSTGTRVATYLYGPFGQILSAAGAMAAINPFRFSSEFHDDETGLVYYNYRYYSPVLGRWTRRDPIGEEEGGVNLYVFTSNASTDNIDSNGLDFIAVADRAVSGLFGMANHYSIQYWKCCQTIFIGDINSPNGFTQQEIKSKCGGSGNAIKKDQYELLASTRWTAWASKQSWIGGHYWGTAQVYVSVVVNSDTSKRIMPIYQDRNPDIVKIKWSLIANAAVDYPWAEHAKSRDELETHKVPIKNWPKSKYKSFQTNSNTFVRTMVRAASLAMTEMSGSHPGAMTPSQNIETDIMGYSFIFYSSLPPWHDATHALPKPTFPA